MSLHQARAMRKELDAIQENTLKELSAILNENSLKS
jgi:hypothetical protein